MKRSGVWFLIIMATISIAAVVAFASSVHLKGGPRAEPAFTDMVLTLTACSELSGLGFEDVTITINATADPTGQCCNPGEACKVPGQNPAPVDVTGSVSIPADKIKNGNLDFCVTTQAPVSPIPGAPDCPGPNWTENITDMAFTSATITVQQPTSAEPTENIVLTVGCDTSSSAGVGTVNGPVPSSDVECLSTP